MVLLAPCAEIGVCCFVSGSVVFHAYPPFCLEKWAAKNWDLPILRELACTLAVCLVWFVIISLVCLCFACFFVSIVCFVTVLGTLLSTLLPWSAPLHPGILPRQNSLLCLQRLRRVFLWRHSVLWWLKPPSVPRNLSVAVHILNLRNLSIFYQDTFFEVPSPNLSILWSYFF